MTKDLSDWEIEYYRDEAIRNNEGATPLPGEGLSFQIEPPPCPNCGEKSWFILCRECGYRDESW